MINTDPKKIEELLTRGVDEVIVKESLEKKLLSGKKLQIKLGIDPTGSMLHLGHAVVLRKLKDFQELGHQVIFLIGDFTAQIGDPTGRSAVRKSMTKKEISANMKSYTKQAGMILDMKKVEVRYNSQWLGKMSFEELIKLSAKVTYAQVAQRADFKERIANDQELSLQEFLYPVMQGYDSVVLKSDVEIGGTDQKFNLLMGRQLQKRYDQEPQDVITCPILEGLSGGDKMSKSLDNYIALTDKPNDMFGKVMSISDDLITQYFELCTYTLMEEIQEMATKMKRGANPRDFKLKLAHAIVSLFHSEKKADAAQEYFINVFTKGNKPGGLEEIEISSTNIVDVLLESKLVSSKSEARRVIEQGGLKVDDQVIDSIDFELKKGGHTIQKGKRHFKKLRVK